MNTHTGDGDDAVFLFDPYEAAGSMDMASSDEERTVSGHVGDLTDGELSLSVDGDVKGKGVSRPVPIGPSNAEQDFQDLFDMGPSGSAASYPSSSATPSSPNFPPSSFASTWEVSTPLDGDNLATLFGSPVDASESTGKGKGKEAELPPSLPPLSFPSPDFSYHYQWPSPLTPIAGPSTFIPPSGIGSSVHTSNSPDSQPGAASVARRHSISNASIQPARPETGSSMARMKDKLNAPRRHLARKLLLRRRASSVLRATEARFREVGEADASQAITLPWLADLPTSEQLQSSIQSSTTLTFQYPGDISYLKCKGRSQSSPFPLTTLDSLVIPTTHISISAPLIIRNHFDEMLPRELRLRVLSLLVAQHKHDYARAVADGEWTVAKASSSRNKYVGSDKGVRELVKLSRVSKSWQTLVFDGHLWESLDLHSFPGLPQQLLLRLTEFSRSFVTELNLAGHVHLDSSLFEVTDNLSVAPSPVNPLLHTQLTNADLQGCNSVTTRSLHHLIAQSPSLRKLNVRGLSAVTNTTCDLLGMYTMQLTALDVSQCKNMDAYGIQSLASSATSRGAHLCLRELRAAGLKYVNDAALGALGRAAPYLEVLDLSYARQLHNSAIEAFVAVDEKGLTEDALGVKIVVLNSREAGRDAGEMSKYRRRVTRLRHLSLSSCILLTDRACAHLAHCVPQLEFLELAGFGDDLREEGLIHLLKTTPALRRLDLEDASEVSDALLACITPSLAESSGDIAGDGSEKPENEQKVNLDPGHALEHLVVSYAREISDAALLKLVRRCHQLRVLEVDNTRVGACVLREFVQLAQKRQLRNARMVAVDCRAVGESLVRELAPITRPRAGWVAYDARKLKFVDARDGELESLKVGQDECDPGRVVLKSFYSWQTVDAVAAAREKKKRATSRRAANESAGSNASDASGSSSGRGGIRWWSPGGRRSGRATPASPTEFSDGCTIM